MELFDFGQISVQDMMLVQAIAECGNVSQAARQNRIAQPTASYRLNKLRDIFSDPIFVSRNRKMNPTTKGERIIEVFSSQIERLSQLAAPEDFDPETSKRTFRILARGFQISAFLKMVPPVFFKQTKQAKLFVEGENNHSSVNLQLHDNADFFASPFEPVGAKGIRRFVSPALKVMVYYDANIRAAPKTVADFAACRFVLLDSLKSQRNFVGEYLSKNGYGTRKIVSYAPTSASIAGFIAGTDLVYVGTSFNTSQGFNELALADIPFEIPPVRHEIRWSISKENDSGHNWLKKILVETSEESLKPSYRVDPNEGFVTLSEFERLAEDTRSCFL